MKILWILWCGQFMIWRISADQCNFHWIFLSYFFFGMMAKFKKSNSNFRPIPTVLRRRRKRRIKMSPRFLSTVCKMKLWNEYIIKEVQDKQQYRNIFMSGQFDDVPFPASRLTSRFDLNFIIWINFILFSSCANSLILLYAFRQSSPDSNCSFQLK
jgi:hypothetical protein